MKGSDQRHGFFVFLVLLSVSLVATGFNTLDAMIWEFYWHPWREWFPNMWGWTPTLRFDVWWSYMLGGILPLAVGCLLLGYLLARRMKC